MMHAHEIGSWVPPGAGRSYDERPKALGLVRADVSGLDTNRHAIEIRRRTAERGYALVYIVRTSRSVDDPIEYALDQAQKIGAAALVVPVCHTWTTSLRASVMPGSTSKLSILNRLGNARVSLVRRQGRRHEPGCDHQPAGGLSGG